MVTKSPNWLPEILPTWLYHQDFAKFPLNSHYKVCFSDETTFEIFQNKAQFVRRRRGEKFHSDCVVQTVKHPTKIMIWSVISGKGTGRLDVVKGMMWQDQYKDVLQNRLVPQLENGFQMKNHTFLCKMELLAIQLGLSKLFWQNKVSLCWIGWVIAML
ncbi:uncharacterized protein TNCV_708591 [Trichonephila clavipes]|nr:uncharacterized protein TNCV_708591 [Trichonephila clavipes]